MKILIHLVRTELWRLRWWLAGWAILQVPGLATFALHGKDDSGGVFYGLTTMQENLLLLWAYLLALDVWVEAAPSGGERFWVSRPISVPMLLASRAIVLFVLLWLVPVLVSVPVWCFWSMAASDWLNALGHYAFTGLSGCFVALAVGVLNPKLARGGMRLLHSLLSLGVVFMVGLGIAAYSYAHLSLRSPDMFEGREIPLYAILSLAVLCSVGVLYALRKRWLAVLVLLVPAAACGSWLLLVPNTPAAPRTTPEAASLLTGLGTWRITKEPGEDGQYHVELRRTDAGKEGPLSLNASYATLEQGGLEVPVFLYVTTPTIQNGDINGVRTFQKGAAGLIGSIGYTSDHYSLKPLTVSRPRSKFDPHQPMRLRGTATFKRMENDAPVEAFLPKVVTQKTRLDAMRPWLVDLEQAGGTLRISAVSPLRLFSACRDLNPEVRLRIFDGNELKVPRGNHSSGYSQFRALGVLWRWDYARLNDPRRQTSSSAVDPRIRLMCGWERQVGEVALDVNVEGMAESAAPAVTDVSK